jgi:hypothetical protein
MVESTVITHPGSKMRAGYVLPNRGRDTRYSGLSRRNIQHTLRYTELSPTRFKDFWRN